MGYAARADRSLPTWSEQLRQAIRASGLTGYQLSKQTGISEAQISRFLRGQRNLTIASAEKLGAAVGLSLCCAKKKRG
jgi:transcriptional regulator with XRE-family HTH domain